jgi:Fur family zinc uptake transcriptional regulator
MAVHDHTLHHGDALAEAARMALLKAGEQWTDMRAQIFASLAAFSKPASAYDIADAVSRARGKRVAANSVYRILDLFVANNLALRVESANAYLANEHPDCVHDCIFLVCDACGQTTHIDEPGRPSGGEECGFHTGSPGDRGARHLRGVRLSYSTVAGSASTSASAARPLPPNWIEGKGALP